MLQTLEARMARGHVVDIEHRGVATSTCVSVVSMVAFGN